MKVKVAKTAGFCWGVRRAMDAVLEASARKKGKVQTIGPLIHNPQALSLLGQRGVGVIDAPENASYGTVLVRAHGIPVGELRVLKDRQDKGEISVINATCPEVAKVHGRIKKWSSRGYFTIILGTHGHAESNAHRSFAESGSMVVSSMEEALAVPQESLKKVLVVAQTTFTAKDFGLIVDAIGRRSQEMIVENTICEDTMRRQEEAERISASVDCVVVVGGKNSSNTKHLAFLAQKNNKPVQFVEEASEIDLGAYRGDESIGVLAGASTPTWLVDEVVDVLQQHGTSPGRLKEFFQEPILMPLLMSSGMSVMTLGIHSWMGIERCWTSVFYVAIVFAYAMAMYLATPFLDPFGLGVKGPARARYLTRHKKMMLAAAALALFAAIGLGFKLGIEYASIVAAASALGLSYKLKTRVFGKELSLRAIPGSKDVLVTLALAIIGLGLPAWHGSHSLQQLWSGRFFCSFLFAASLVFARSITASLADLQRDQILGRETLPILIGRNMSKFMMYALLLAAWCFNGLYAIQEPNFGALAVLSGCALYPMAHQWYYRIRFSAGRPSFDPGIEPALFLAGLLALFAGQ
jgi:4-hydroxy-3-methylbut-2-enyl diphosphate reductase